MDAADALALVLLGLAAYRCAALLVLDELPFGAFRDWLHEPQRCPPHPTAERDASAIGYLWTCMSCMSVWTTIAWWGAWQLAPDGTLVAATPFAIAGLARALRPT